MTRPRLDGRKAIVTGGNAGIGKVISQCFAAEGASCALLARRREQGEAVVAEITADGGKARFFHCDVTSAEHVATAVTAASQWLQGVDLLVNNSGGVTHFNSFPDEDPQEWADTIALNLHGPFHMCRAAWPLLREASNAAVINISSVSAVSGIGRDQLALMGAQPPASYSAGKMGLEGLSLYLAGIGGADNIRVNCIRPGRILTEEYREMLGEDGIFWNFYRQAQLLKRHGESTDIAAAAVFLASEDSRFITGKVLDVDGGAALQI